MPLTIIVFKIFLSVPEYQESALEPVPLVLKSIRLPSSTNTITGNQAKFSAVLEENVTSCLLRVDANTIICNNCTGAGIDFELLGAILENGGKRCRFWYL